MLRSLRSWWRTALVAIACVALGTGSVVFVLSVANGVLLKPPPFADADRLVRIWTTAEEGGANGDVSFLDARDLAARTSSFQSIELSMRTRLAVSVSGVTERVRGEAVSSGYLDLVQVQPALGRAFAPDEYAVDAAPVVVISHRLWQQRFGGATDVLGRTLLARSSFGRDNDRSLTIIGVMPPGFIGTVDPDISDFWIPVEQYQPTGNLERRTARGTWVLARLRPGITVETAAADVRQVGAAFRAEYPADYAGLRLTAESVGESFRSRYRDGIGLLGGVAAFLLLIACTNVTHLLLARLAQREQEFRVRTALGATRSMLVRDVLRESAVIAALGGMLGLALATVALRMAVASGAFQLPPYVQLGVDLRVALGAVLASLACALLSGGIPAWLASRRTATESLRDDGRSGTMTRTHRRGTHVIVAAEVALSFVLLVGAALMVRSYGNLLAADPGFRTDRMLRLAVSLDATAFPDAAAILRYADETRAALEAHPAVEGASVIAGTLPPWLDDEAALGRGGRVAPGLGAVGIHPVDPAFLDVMDIGLVAGRGLQPTDVAGAPRVAVVSAAVARTLAGGDGREAIGQTVAVGIGPDGSPAGTDVLIVGIAGDVMYTGPMGGRARQHDLYLPLAQAPRSVLSIAVATRGEGARLRDELVQLTSARAPTSPMHWISTMDEEFSLQFRDARLYAGLTGFFGTCAVVLVLLGLYGVIAHAVVRRLPELSVRLAVGATPAQVSALVVRQVVAPAVAGILAGGAAALAASRVASALLYGLSPTDPLAFGLVAVTLLAASLLAAFAPARRAARLDPASVLGTR